MAFQIPIWLNDKVQPSNGPESRPEQAGIASCRGTLLVCLYGVLVRKALDLVVFPLKFRGFLSRWSEPLLSPPSPWPSSPSITNSDYSLLDGAQPVAADGERLWSWVCPALALTDRGVMYGAIELLKLCTQGGQSKPIIRQRECM